MWGSFLQGGWANAARKAALLTTSTATPSAIAALSRRMHTSTVANNMKVLLSDPIDPVCTEILQNAGIKAESRKLTKEQLLQVIGEYDGLIVRSGTTVTADVIKAGNRLKLIGRAGTGVDNIDVDAATKKGVVVMNTPGGNTTSAAELTMSMIMALSRNIPNACNTLKNGVWDRKNYMGVELAGKTIGIVGLGRIGREVARWCQGFGMTTVGYDPIVSAELMLKSGIQPVTLDKLYATSDFITLHTPLTNSTRNMLNDEVFARCKKGVRIVNCARGGILDEHALLRALKAGQCAGAALDVFEQEPPPADLKELLSHPAVICTPHLGASTSEAQVTVARDIATQFVNAIFKDEYVGVVNAPHLGIPLSEAVKSYTELAEKLGSLQAQLLRGKIRKISVILQGRELSADGPSSVVSSAVLKGLLSHLTEEAVNMINAKYIAEELGLTMSVHQEGDVAAYSNLLSLVFETDAETKILRGTVFQGTEPRIVEMDGFKLDLNPEGNLIFFNNTDKPGVLATITTTLAKNGINIANFTLGRHGGVGSNALGVVSIDDALSNDAFKQLEQLPDVLNLRYATLGYLTGEDITRKSSLPKPGSRPKDANFGSGPCKKRPGYSLDALKGAPLGRSHRSAIGKNKLKKAINDTRRILGLPEDYFVGIVPASDTGAVEMAMWSLLGPREVDVLHWESFGSDWYADSVKQLKLKTNSHKAGYGDLPDLTKVNFENDVVFTWNGTTAGVKVPNGDWIPDDRKGLTICDATSAVFAMQMPWKKLDVVTYSWQKVLGGEGAHGMLILSPRAVERLESYKPSWPMPKIFRLTSDGKFSKTIFTEGNVINTPSMLCVEDYIDALAWAERMGGVEGLIKRSEANLAAIEDFVAKNPWAQFLAKDKSIRSNTSICLTLDLPAEKVKALTKLLEKEGVAYDIDAYRSAPPGLRIWGGSTIETSDVNSLLNWLKWAYHEVKDD
eukprot:TRINITY_DN2720_c0_g1_i1.p1 TRINITY_DN2720_c0_g1~~TRINITY_DN2720_c0_g1_i1.p1  ORF type:complete len:961 (+),score=241.57 TRINITY_DN2720_c0_g1_i1:50-2932(+)